MYTQISIQWKCKACGTKRRTRRNKPLVCLSCGARRKMKQVK